MINYVYQLIAPRTITVKYKDVDTAAGNVIIRPEYLSICHADQRYYKGERDAAVLKKKLPMALIHEAMGRVVHDPSGTFKKGEKVVVIGPSGSGKSTFLRCLNLLEIVNEALACNARCQQSSCQKFYAKQGDRKAVWKQIHSGIEREQMFLKLQRHLLKQEGVLAKQWKRMC